MSTTVPSNVRVRALAPDDYDDLCAVMRRAYSFDNVWTFEQYKRLLELFPEGQVGVEADGRLAAAALSIIVDYAHFGDAHQYRQIHGNGSFNTHDSKGDVLYGLDIVVDPDFRGLRFGRRLYDARKELCESLNLRAIVAGGRMPGYDKHAPSLSPKGYIEKVKNRELYDPVLSFQISNGFHVRRVLTDYLDYDKESRAYATLIEWINVDYDPLPYVGGTKSYVRTGVVQWQMRNFDSLALLLDAVEFFVDAVSGYRADFICLPESILAPLLAAHGHLQEPQAIRELAKSFDAYRERMVAMAVKYNVNIIAGSAPRLDGGRLYNTALLCRRDGSWAIQDKLHPTPDEARVWALSGGPSLKVFDTDCGRIGILICYDVEFPELSRRLADEGVEILFVPFQTDTLQGFTRVQRCAMARAVENECYVVISGSVGNLPKVENTDIQYAQSAVFSPADHSFPNRGVVREAQPGIEMMLVADLDLDLLRHLHHHGSVQTLKDRRRDLYRLDFMGPLVVEARHQASSEG